MLLSTDAIKANNSQILPPQCKLKRELLFMLHHIRSLFYALIAPDICFAAASPRAPQLMGVGLRELRVRET